MSKVYRQTISDELAAKVEATRAALGLSIQELTLIALALFCQAHATPAPAADPQPEYELTF